MTDAARELELFIQNNEPIYVGIYWPTVTRIKKHWDKGQYDMYRANAAFRQVCVAAAREYVREFASCSDKWYQMFDMEDRRQTAKSLQESFEQKARDGEI